MNLFQLLTLSVVTAVLAAEFLGLCRRSAGRKLAAVAHRCVVRRGRGDRGSRNPSSHRDSHRHRSGSRPCPVPGRPGVPWVSFYFYSCFVQLQRQLTEVVRYVSMQNARRGRQEGED